MKCTVYTVQYTEYNTNNARYIIHGRVYREQYSVQRTVHRVTVYGWNIPSLTGGMQQRWRRSKWVHSKQYRGYSTQCTVHWGYSAQYAICSLEYTRHNIHFTVHSDRYTVYSTQYKYRVYTIHYTVHSIQYTIYSTQYKLNSIHNALHSIQCAV